MAWRRRAVRAVLLDPDGRLFLQQGRDPWDPSIGPYWFLAGGGIDGREDPAEALRRELWEECGFGEVVVEDLLWEQRARFRFAGIDFDQDEQIYLARVPEVVEARPVALEALEAAAFLEPRWWALPDLLTTTEHVVYPEDLRHRLRAAGLVDHLAHLFD